MTGLGLSAVALLGALAACDGVQPSFFRPASETSPDRSPPRFADPRPGPDIAVVSGDAFTLEVTDPAGADGVSSGIDPASILATHLGVGPLPVTVALPRVTIDIGAVPDGTLQIAVTVEDRAGNSALYLFSHVLDRTPPPLGFPAPLPPAALETARPELSIPIRVQVGPEPHFESGTIAARTPGPDGTCGTADDGAIPSEVLADPERPITGVGVTGVTFVLDNPVPAGSAHRIESYCWVARAVDSARAPDGTPGVNVATIAARTEVTWRPPAS